LRLGNINGILRRLESTDQPPPRRYSADEHPVKGKIWGPGGACGRTGGGRGRRSNVTAAAPGRSAARRWGPGPGSALRQGGRPRGQRPEPAGAGAEGPRSGVRDGRGSGGPHEDPQWSRSGACAPHSRPSLATNRPDLQAQRPQRKPGRGGLDTQRRAPSSSWHCASAAHDRHRASMQR